MMVADSAGNCTDNNISKAAKTMANIIAINHDALKKRRK